MMFDRLRHRGRKNVEINVVDSTIIIIDDEPWYHHSHKHKDVQLVLTAIINQFKIRIMSLQLNANQFSLAPLGLIDQDTQVPVNATFANASFVGDNDAAFTVAADPSDSNVCKVTGVAGGTGTVKATADATYTDSVSGQPTTKTGLTIVVDVTVVAVSAGENVALTLNFGTPQTNP